MIGTKALRAMFTAASRAPQVLALVLPALWVLAVLGWELADPPGPRLEPLLAAAPVLALALGGRCSRVLTGGLGALAALAVIAVCRPHETATAPLGSCAAVVSVLVACGLTNRRRLRLLKELDRTQAVAVAAQRTLLRPLPPRLEQLAIAGGQLSASRGAVVGGDLYEVLATPHGVRIVIGDVRGHGIGALGTVAAVLGSFREAAHDEPELTGVLNRLDRALCRHLHERTAADQQATEPAGGSTGGPAAGEGAADSAGADAAQSTAEDFVTLLLLEVLPSGEVMALNCGHPWPILLVGQGHGRPVGPRRAGRRTLAHRSALPQVTQLAPDEPMPPLGAFPLPQRPTPIRCTLLLPGEALVLYTDGAPDARDADGLFFPLTCALAWAARGGPVHPQSVVDQVHDALLQHTGGRLTDDAALVVLRNDRSRVPAQAPVTVPAGDAQLS